MIKPVVWITGAGGLLGNYMLQAATAFASQWHPVGLTRANLDLADFRAVQTAFAGQKPSAIIHCAALSRSAGCQADPSRAKLINVLATENLCALAAHIPFVFFSTDLVFDGRKGRYSEEDAVNPLSVYAESKVQAEQQVLRNPRHTVVRLSLNLGVSPTRDRSFTEEMRVRWERSETLNLFTDEFRSPLPALLTARAVWELLGRDRAGLFHLAGAERLSRWEIGQLLARRWPDLTCRMTPSSAVDFIGPRRPLDTSLNCSKVQAELSFPLPRLTDWLLNNPQIPV